MNESKQPKGKARDGIRYLEDKKIYQKRFMIAGVRHSVYGKTRKECLTKEAEIRFKSDAGSYVKSDSITLDKYFTEWEKLKADCKPNTLRSYISTYQKHISPSIGRTRIQKIDRRQIQKLIIEKSIEISAHTANYCLRVLKMVLSDAARDGIISENPAKYVKAIKDENKDKAYNTIHRGLSREEISVFFNYAEESMFKNLFKLQLYTGMRPGEVTALRLSDIDRKKNCIHVLRTATYDIAGKLTEGSPKTYTSKRDIPLNIEILKVLQEQMEQNKILFGNVISVNGLIFPGQNGQMIRNCALDRGIERILKRAAAAGKHVEKFSAHGFRDTFATNWVEQGKPAHVLQKILGHRTLGMTMDRYYHLPEQTKQDEMSSLVYAI